MNWCRTRDEGFTLVEVLVTLVIFALLAAASTSVLSITLNTRETIAEREADLRSIQLARALMKADFAQMVGRPVRDPFGGLSPASIEGGFAIRNDPGVILRFSRRGWINPGGRANRGDLQYVTYRFENGELKRQTRLRTDPGPQTGEISRVLFDQLIEVRIRFFNGTIWQDDWTTGDFASAELPRALSLTLTHEGGDQIEHLFVVKGAAP